MKLNDKHVWGIIVIIGIAVILFIYKIVASETDINLEQFYFSDLLAIILSLFAIVLSGLFYFKANDVSNQFYNNSFKLTNELSTLLGRMEERFDARLDLIDKEAKGIFKVLKTIQDIDPKYIEKNQDKYDEEIQKLKLEVKERDKALISLFDKANLQQEEREKYLNFIKSKEDKIQKIEEELNFIKNKINKAKLVEIETLRGLPKPLQYLLILLATHFKEELVSIDDGINESLKKYIEENCPIDITEELIKKEIINKNFEPTELGLNLLQFNCKLLPSDL